MTEEQINPVRIDDDIKAGLEDAGTAGASPVDGLEMDEAQHDEAVEPDDKALDLDGPTPGHA